MKFTLRNDLLGYSGQVATWGIAWGDADGDGDMDLWLGHHGPNSNLLINRLDEPSATFEVRQTGSSGDKHGAVWADFDADGDLDLLQLRGGGKGGKVEKDMEVLGNLLLVNQGLADGVPVLAWTDDGLDETDSRGLYYSASRGRTPTVLDIDRDGRLDVVLGNEGRTDGTFPTAAFLQRQDGHFRIAPGALGVDANGVTLAMPGDFDGDGITDLYLVHAGAADSTIVYGNGAGFAARTAPVPQALRDPGNLVADVAIADFNNDGTSDLWLASHGDRGFDSLILNIGGRFVDVSAEAGLRSQGFLTRNVAAGDFDNDGDIDLYAVNGDYGGSKVRALVPNVLWENTGVVRTALAGGGTALVPHFVPRIGPQYAEGGDNAPSNTVSVGDINGDGALDLVLGNGARLSLTGTDMMSRGTYDLYLGEADPGNDWLIVSLEGTVSNIHGIGSTVLATTAGGVTRMRFADNGVHEGTQDDPRLHFGFGDLEEGARITLEIRWINGMVQELAGLRPGRIITVTEGEGQAGADRLEGTGAAESLAGWGGADTLSGADGMDTLSGGGSADLLSGGTGDDSLRGGQGLDTLNGDAGDDYLAGGEAADRLLGGDGRDTLLGGTGADTLAGEKGDDVLTGGGGADLFAFTGAVFGQDRITDFSLGRDTLLLDPGAVVAVADGASGAELRVGTAGTILLEGLSAAQVLGQLDIILG